VRTTSRSNDLLAQRMDASQPDPLDALLTRVAAEANDIWACGIADALKAGLSARHAALWLMLWAGYTLEDCCLRLDCKRRMYYYLKMEMETWLKENNRRITA
jgi:hypothetical protein